MLFADPAVGGDEFFESLRKALQGALGVELQELPAEHAIVSGRFARGAGCDVSSVRFTRAGARKAGAASGKPALLGLMLNGRLAVVLSRYGVTCPMEGIPTFGQVGLVTDDARRLAANVVLYAIWGADE
jgi:hypothetical protein